MNFESEELIAKFSYHLGLFCAGLALLKNSDEAGEWFSQRDIASRDYKKLEEALQPFQEALYK